MNEITREEYLELYAVLEKAVTSRGHAYATLAIAALILTINGGDQTAASDIVKQVFETGARGIARMGAVATTGGPGASA